MISLTQQAEAVLHVLLNRRGWHATLKSNLENRVRGATEENVRIAALWIPELEAAHATLAALAEQEKAA